MIKHELTARLADGTPAPNKLGDSVKTLKHTLSGLEKQIFVYGDKFPAEAVRNMQRQIDALEIALPILEWELTRRKSSDPRIQGQHEKRTDTVQVHQANEQYAPGAGSSRTRELHTQIDR